MGMSDKVFSLLASFETSPDPAKVEIFRIYSAIKQSFGEQKGFSEYQNNPNGYFLGILELMFALFKQFPTRSDAAFYHQLYANVEFMSLIAPAVSSPIVLKSREQLFLLLNGVFDLACTAQQNSLLRATIKCFVRCSERHFSTEWFEKRTEVAQFYEKILLNMKKYDLSGEVKKIRNGFGLFLRIVASNSLPGSVEDMKNYLAILEAIGELDSIAVNWLPSAIDRIFEISFAELESRKFSVILKLLCLFCRCTKNIDFIAKWTMFFGDLYPDSQLDFKQEIAAFLKSAIGSLGCRLFFSVYPLDLVSSPSHSRTWLISVAKNAIFNDELGYFFEYFLPIAQRISTSIKSYVKNGKIIEAKVHSMLYDQIWDLFASFCLYPRDFELVGETLFSAIVQAFDDGTIPLNILCNAINNLVTSTQQSTQLKVGFDYDRFKQGLCENLKQIIVALFNKYSNTCSAERGFLLDCIKNCFTVIEVVEVENVFKICLKEILLTDLKSLPNPLRIHALVDIVVASIPYLNIEYLQLCLKYFLNLFQQDHLETVMEKKAYKALHEMLKHLSNELITPFMPLLQHVVQKSSPASKQNRLGFLSELVKMVDFPSLQLIAQSILPELLVGAKEMADKSKQLATDTLLLLGLRFREASGNLEEFKKLVITGLAGKSPLMISATIHCIGIISFEFQFSSHEMFEFMDLFLALHSLPSNEILRSIFEFLKITFKLVPDEEFKARLPQIIPILMEWSNKDSSTLRLAIKNFVEKFIRRWGYDFVQEALPQSYYGVIRNIRKKNNRKGHETVIDEDDKESFIPFALQDSLVTAERSSGQMAPVLRGDAGKPVDLLNKQQVLIQSTQQTGKKRKMELSDDDEDKIAFNAEGRLQITLAKDERHSDDSEGSDEEIMRNNPKKENPKPSQNQKTKRQKIEQPHKTPNESVSFVPLRNTVVDVKSKKALKMLRTQYRFK